MFKQQTMKMFLHFPALLLYLITVYTEIQLSINYPQSIERYTPSL